MLEDGKTYQLVWPDRLFQHLVLHQQSPLTKQHFVTWLRYFKESVDELFEGEKAFQAKERATSIATVMQIKISQLGQNPATHP